MCNIIYVMAEERELNTPRELAEWLGVSPDDLTPADDSGEHRELPTGNDWRDFCLCQIDIDASLDRAKIYHYQDETGDTYAAKLK